MSDVRPEGRIFINNWNRYQAAVRKGCSNYPWFKLYRAFFNDFHVRELSESDRYKLLGIMSIADSSTGEIIKCDAEICFMIGIKSIPWGKFDGWICDATGDATPRATGGATGDARGDALEKIRIDKNREDKIYKANEKDGALRLFDTFWSMYPGRRKKGKPQARDKFVLLINKDGVPAGDIIGGLERAIDSPEWAKKGGEYIPGPVPFLNQHQWECEWGATVEDSETHETRTEGSL